MNETLARQSSAVWLLLRSKALPRLLFQRRKPATENVLGRIGVAVAGRPAMLASPTSYQQALSAFRTADHTAVRTGLSAVPFVNFREHRPSRNRIGAGLALAASGFRVLISVRVNWGWKC